MKMERKELGEKEKERQPKKNLRKMTIKQKKSWYVVQNNAKHQEQEAEKQRVLLLVLVPA